ncbi:cytochrome b [Azoarcus sp. DD4]|uniref:cytochrome b n=1 Tax=Azoarcus sp. DD4 TaxID=2027405 RepID=UPI00112EE63E|nr:cytochrome b [Azoarcus sp. DD4]QDF98293.1 cytochrome b [Azoarcus sp. DD4]
MNATPTARYNRTAIALHWLIALALAAIFGLGLYMHELPLSPAKLKLYSWHKWAGVTVFVLVAIRLGWRLAHPAPALPATMPAPLRLAAGAAHGLLYLLMFSIPLSGWLMSSAKGFQTVWFGVLPLPDLVGKDAALGDALQGLHFALNMLLAAIVAGHAGAALKHHFLDRDDVLTRMLPGAGKA